MQKIQSFLSLEGELLYCYIVQLNTVIVTRYSVQGSQYVNDSRLYIIRTSACICMAAQRFRKWSEERVLASCACASSFAQRVWSRFIALCTGGALLCDKKCAWLEKVVRRSPDQPAFYAALDMHKRCAQFGSSRDLSRMYV